VPGLAADASAKSWSRHSIVASVRISVADLGGDRALKSLNDFNGCFSHHLFSKDLSLLTYGQPPAPHPALFFCICKHFAKVGKTEPSQVGNILVSRGLAGKFAIGDDVEEIIGVLVHPILAR
jgi:hypothetical protein